MEAWRTTVVEVAKSWIGTPWHHAARIKGAGVDCAQLLIGVYVEAGLVESFETEAYPMDWMLHREEEKFLSYVDQHMNPVALPSAGDTAVWVYGRCFSHAAIVVDWPVLIHAYRKERGVVWGDATKGELAGRTVRFYTPRMS